MAKALICEKWELNFAQELEYKDSKVSDQSNMERVVKIEKVVADCVLASTMILDKFSLTVDYGLDVVELYGGSGFQTTVIQNLLRPTNHTIVEQDENCVAQLKREFPKLTVIKGKAEDNYNIKADYYSLDYDWTINTFVTNKNKNKDMFEGIFAFQPQAIQFWDSARSHLPANRKLYSKHFGKEIITAQDYSQAISEFFYKNYNYSTTYVCYPRYQGLSTYFLLQPGKHEAEIMRTNDVPEYIKGFRWI